MPLPIQENMSVADSTLMSTLPAIYGLQSKRSLKRSLLELEKDQDNHHGCFKRQRLFAFLDAMPLPTPPPHITRSLSDSSLLCSMSFKPPRSTKAPQRYEQEFPVSRKLGVHTPTPSSTSAPMSFKSGTTSITPVSQVESTTLRAQRPSYREDLHDNGIEFVSSRKAPADIVKCARAILNRSRDSPGLTEEGAEAVAQHMDTLRHDGDEFNIVLGYNKYGIFPDGDENITRGGNRPFDHTALPRTHGAPTLAKPIPDQCYAHHHQSFDVSQRALLNNSFLQSYSKPVTTGYFPFFTIEFKSTARFGSTWVAENQAATSGALCVNSMEKLLSIVDRHTDQLDSISFSSIMNERSATIWCHYCDRERGKYFSVEVEQYWMEKAKDVIACRNSIKNILGWALKERLPGILKVLEECDPRYFEAQHKSQRSRTSDIDRSSSTSKRRVCSDQQS